MGRYHPKRLLFGALVLLLIYIHVRHTQNDEFYTKTVKALSKQSKDKAWKEDTDAKFQKILNDKNSPQIAIPAAEPESAALPTDSDSTPHLPPDPPSPPNSPPQDNTSPKNSDASKPKYATSSTSSDSSTSISTSSSDSSSPDPPHLAQVRAALDEIIHHHSIVIFSKTYCPHSRRAKTLLLQTYDIVPRPYVVELDKLNDPAEGNSEPETGRKSDEGDDKGVIVTMGRALQDLLAQRTGRKTVPNILVLGMSIGGADEVVRLHDEDGLADKLKTMVGKRLEKCERRREVGTEENEDEDEDDRVKDSRKAKPAAL